MIRSSFFLWPCTQFAHRNGDFRHLPASVGATGSPTPKPTLHARIPAHPLSHTCANIRENPT